MVLFHSFCMFTNFANWFYLPELGGSSSEPYFLYPQMVIKNGSQGESSSDDYAYHDVMIMCIYTYIHIIWVNYNDLTATSLEIMVNKGNHPQMTLIQVGELL